jgi:hypothetical protein
MTGGEARRERAGCGGRRRGAGRAHAARELEAAGAVRARRRGERQGRRRTDDPARRRGARRDGRAVARAWAAAAKTPLTEPRRRDLPYRGSPDGPSSRRRTRSEYEGRAGGPLRRSGRVFRGREVFRAWVELAKRVQPRAVACGTGPLSGDRATLETWKRAHTQSEGGGSTTTSRRVAVRLRAARRLAARRALGRGLVRRLREALRDRGLGRGAQARRRRAGVVRPDGAGAGRARGPLFSGAPDLAGRDGVLVESDAVSVGRVRWSWRCRPSCGGASSTSRRCRRCTMGSPRGCRWGP